MIDPARDAVAGEWKHTGRKLISPSGPPQFARLKIPYTPPDEYVLNIEGLKHGKWLLGVGLPVAPGQCLVTIDVWPEKGFITLLEKVDGKAIVTHRGKVLKENDSNTIVCEVRRSGVKVVCNDITIVQWQGNGASLSINNPVWEVNAPTSIFLTSSNSRFVFRRIELTPLSSQGQR
jgi:hypothetical protein